jgi:hypothetical protein
MEHERRAYYAQVPLNDPWTALMTERIEKTIDTYDTDEMYVISSCLPREVKEECDANHGYDETTPIDLKVRARVSCALKRQIEHYYDWGGEEEWYAMIREPYRYSNARWGVSRGSYTQHADMTYASCESLVIRVAYMTFERALSSMHATMMPSQLRNISDDDLHAYLTTAVNRTVEENHDNTSLLEELVSEAGVLDMLTFLQDTRPSDHPSPHTRAQASLTIMGREALRRLVVRLYVEDEEEAYFEVEDNDADAGGDSSDDDDDDDYEETITRSGMSRMIHLGDASTLVTSEGECELCSDTVEPIVTLPCNHPFGVSCLSAWAQKQYSEGIPTTCPMCRAIY